VSGKISGMAADLQDLFGGNQELTCLDINAY